MMDAISFVLGEKTSNLRVKTVKVNSNILFCIRTEISSLF